MKVPTGLILDYLKDDFFSRNCNFLQILHSAMKTKCLKNVSGIFSHQQLLTMF